MDGMGTGLGRGLVAWLALTMLVGSARADRGPTLLPVPGIRLEAGPHFLLPQPDAADPAQPVDPLVLPDRGGRLTLGLQLQVAVLSFSRWNRASAWGLFPEAGYVYQRRDLGTTALFNLGVGLGYMPTPLVYFAYMPRFVVGRVYGADAGGNLSPDLYRTAIGLRHGPLVGLLFGILNVELSHQLLWLEGRQQHEGMLLLGVDVLRLVILSLVSGFRR